MSPLLPTILLAAAATAVTGPYIAMGLHSSRFLTGLRGIALACRLMVLLFLLLWFVPYYSDTGIDAVAYHYGGIDFSEALSRGAWTQITWGFGTPAMYLLTALLYYPFGPSLYGGYIVGALVGLTAGILFIKATVVLGYRPKNMRPYGAAMLILPSFAMWTSVAGKDSWVGLGLALFSYGYALGLRGRFGLVYSLLGLVLTTIIRPHIAVILMIGVAAATTLVGGSRVRTRKSRLPLVTGALIGLTLTVWATTRFLGLQEVNADAIFGVSQTISDGNRVGGSVVDESTQYRAIGDVIRDAPAGVVRILLRPFPWEVNNLNEALASAENIVVAALLITSFRRLSSISRGLVKDRYLFFCLVIVVQMMVLLLPIPNLGLLSRMRAHMMPFLFAVLLLPRQRSTGVAFNSIYCIGVSSEPPAFGTHRHRWEQIQS